MKQIFMVLALAVFALANQDYYLKSNYKYLKDGKQIATITTLTPVEIVSEKGNKALVKIKGLVNEGYQERIIKAPDKNEIFVNFTDTNESATYKGDVNPYFKVLKKVEDDYGESWLEVEFDLELPKDTITNNADELYKEAKTLYEQTCSACHRLHNPKDFTISQWPSNLASMQNSGFVAFDEQESELVIKYLQHNAKDSK